MRILIVEDDPLNVELFEAALETEHEIVIDRDGVSGEARALSEKFDLVLLDVQLPKRGGIEVCGNLRAAGVRIPIVALSASVLPEEVARTTEAGFDVFWSKPISPPDLRAAVKSINHPSARRD